MDVAKSRRPGPLDTAGHAQEGSDNTTQHSAARRVPSIPTHTCITHSGQTHARVMREDALQGYSSVDEQSIERVVTSPVLRVGDCIEQPVAVCGRTVTLVVSGVPAAPTSVSLKQEREILFFSQSIV